MRFKARLEDANTLQKTFAALNIGKNQRCVINLTPDKWCLHLSGHYAEDGVQVFIDLDKKIFSQHGRGYQIQSKRNNEIILEVEVGVLERVLKTAKDMSHTIVKIENAPAHMVMASQMEREARGEKKGKAVYLVFEMYEAEDHKSLEQKVPVLILPHTALNDLQEPNIPPPQVKISLPEIRQFIGVLTKMSRLGRDLDLHLEASNEGKIQLSVNNDAVSIKTYYSDLTLHGHGELPERTDHASVKIKKFMKLTKGVMELGEVDGQVLCIVESYALVIHVMLAHQMGTATFYVPVFTADDFDSD